MRDRQGLDFPTIVCPTQRQGGRHAKAKATKATKLPKLPDGSVFKPEGAKLGMTGSVAVAKPAKAKGISKPGELYRDRDAMFNHLFDAKMGITAKKATKGKAGSP